MTDHSMTLFQNVAVRLGRKKFQNYVDEKIREIPSSETANLSISKLEGHPLALRGEESAFSVPLPIFEKTPVTPAGKVYRVGIWDINSLAGDMALVTSTLNQAQSRIRFFEVSEAVPSGLVSDKARLLAWLAERKRKVSAAEKREIEENTIADDFYPHAQKLRHQMGLDYIVGLTYSMIALDVDGHAEFNYFAGPFTRRIDIGFAAVDKKHRRELLVSTYELRQYAEKAGRSLEAALGGVLLSILLAAMNSQLRYHDHTGCLFDFNEDRDSIVDSIRAAQIEPECLRKIRPGLREASEAMVAALRNLPKPRSRRKSSK